MFIGRNVAEAAREKGSRTKVSPAEMAALGEIARVFEIVSWMRTPPACFFGASDPLTQPSFLRKEPPSVDQMK